MQEPISEIYIVIANLADNKLWDKNLHLLQSPRLKELGKLLVPFSIPRRGLYSRPQATQTLLDEFFAQPEEESLDTSSSPCNC